MRGLAFSGGAAFGAYQTGAWLEIHAQGWRPDVVSGISIGGVNAYLVAHGATPEEMLRTWLEWPAELMIARERRFALPWAKQTPMFLAWLDRIAETFGPRPLQARLRLVVLEAFTLRQTVLEDDAIDGEALVAACALPGILPPKRLDGKLCIDCGVLRYEPLKECLDLGADEIISVNLLKKHPFPPARWARERFLGALDRLRGDHSEPTQEELQELDLTEIGHSQVLGSLTETFQWTRESAERLIELGRQDARGRRGRQAKNAAPRQTSQPEPVNTAPK